MYTKLSIAVMVSLIWIVPFSVLIPTQFGIWGKFGLDKSTASCTILPDANGNSPKTFLFVISFLLPSIAILFCYMKIYTHVRKNHKKVCNNYPISSVSSTSGFQDGGNSSSYTFVQRNRSLISKNHRRVLEMSLVIFISFIICFFPATLITIFKWDYNPNLNIFGMLLVYMTTCINPIVYISMSSEYRKAFMGIWK